MYTVCAINLQFNKSAKKYYCTKRENCIDSDREFLFSFFEFTVLFKMTKIVFFRFVSDRKLLDFSYDFLLKKKKNKLENANVNLRLISVQSVSVCNFPGLN